MAGKDPIRVMADFDRHFMPDDDEPMHDSARGNANEHRTELKRNAEGISRSQCEVFAYLTHGTTSLEEAKKLLTIITNVYILIFFIAIIYIMMLISIQLDFKPQDIPHSSLRSMARHVRRAMLPGNHEVFTKSFAEGTVSLSCYMMMIIL